MNKQKLIQERLWVLAAIALALFVMIWRLAHISQLPRSWDEVDFALALERYDLLAMQPHFPGYPYFILGGMLLQRLGIADPVRALSVFNIIVTTLSIFPIYGIARKRWSSASSLWLAVTVTTPAYIWILSAVPMSEAAALGALWWYLWSVDRGMEQTVWSRRYVLPLLFFGILMGIRVSFAPFGVGLLLLAYRDLHLYPSRFTNRLMGAVLLGALLQLIWIAGLVSSEGTISGFIVMAKGFVNGHFQDWGGTIVTEADPFWLRFVKLSGNNLVWAGMLVHSKLLAVLLGASIVGIAGASFFNKDDPYDKGRAPEYRLIGGLILMLVMYFVWVLLGQNIDKPRHIAPLIAGFIFLLCWWSMKSVSKRRALAFMLVLSLAQGSAGTILVAKQAAEQPAIYQMAELLSQRKDKFILYTWEETRLLQYLHVNFSHQRVLTYKLFLDQLRAAPGKKILLTDHVLAGFEQQSGSLSDKVKLIAEFQSEPLFDPVYSHIRLYEWTSP